MAGPGRPKKQRLNEETENWLLGEYQKLLKDQKATISNRKGLLDSIAKLHAGNKDVLNDLSARTPEQLEELIETVVLPALAHFWRKPAAEVLAELQRLTA